MPFEENDMRILEAADHHHPAYDEKAWDKMEKLLDKHLPVQKKDKRRIVFWLFLFLLAGGGVTYFLARDNDAKNETAVVINEKPAIPGDIENKTTKKNNDPELTAQDEKIPVENLPAIKPLPSSGNKNKEPLIFLPTKPSAKRQTGLVNNYLNPVFKNHPDISGANKNILQQPQASNDVITKSVTYPLANNTVPASSETKKDSETKNIVPEKTSDNSATPKTQETNTGIPKKNTADEITVASPEKKSKSGKQKTSKGNGLFFSISAGPELGNVGTDNSGKIKPVLGAGIGYAFNNRLSIQTGFYSVRKIYSAAGQDYNAPEWWQRYYPNLEKVDADCKVYEIPLTVSYNFITSKKSNWFGALGISSYLMKKEDYTYHYKTNAGQYRTSRYTFNNENKNLFSIAGITAGYERKINKNISLSLAPYLKLPLSGVGFGKVKLNSAGVMVSAVIKPFARK